MAREYHELTLSYTVKDYEHLPAGMYADDVARKVWDVARKALTEWYHAEGHDYFACEPDFLYEEEDEQS